MLRIALRETKINKFFIIFASLGLSVLFGIVFVLSNFNSQMNTSYWGRYEQGKTIALESTNAKMFDYSLDGLFVYGRTKGLTYDTTLEYDSEIIKIPSYWGGLCIYSVNESIDVVPNLLYGDSFSLSEHAIWVTEALYTNLGCSLGSEIKLNDQMYYVAGVFENDNTPTYYSGEVSFFIYSNKQKVQKPDSLVVVVAEPMQLTELAKIDNGEIFNDRDGILELCRGYNTLHIGMVFITCVLGALLLILLISIVRIYLFKRQEFIRILHRNGISTTKLITILMLFFSIIAILACSLAIIWSCIFNSLIISWADSILHIIIEKPNYVIQWLLGFSFSLIIVALTLPFLLKKKYYEWEVANQ
ncbi:MAG: hypothetical protein E7353_09120 [Clostridiales bacterium]|nr:hypothetical protein [Clostridiales bacterium]